MQFFTLGSDRSNYEKMPKISASDPEKESRVGIDLCAAVDSERFIILVTTSPCNLEDNQTQR